MSRFFARAQGELLLAETRGKIGGEEELPRVAVQMTRTMGSSAQRTTMVSSAPAPSVAVLST